MMTENERLAHDHGLLTTTEWAAMTTLQEWLRDGRSSTATVKLSKLVRDDKAWVPPRARVRRRGGTLAWFRVCQLRAFCARKGGLADFRQLLMWLEDSEDADMAGVHQGIALVHGYVRGCIALRSIRAAEALNRPVQRSSKEQDTGRSRSADA